MRVRTARAAPRRPTIAVLVTVAAARTDAVAETTASADALVGGYEWGFASGAILAVAAALAAAILLPSGGDET